MGGMITSSTEVGLLPVMTGLAPSTSPDSRVNAIGEGKTTGVPSWVSDQRRLSPAVRLRTSLPLGDLTSRVCWAKRGDGPAIRSRARRTTIITTNTRSEERRVGNEG